MAHKRKDQLTVSGEWAKHLRKFFRKQFWKRERKAGKDLIRQERQHRGLTASGMNKSLWQISIYLTTLFLFCLGSKVSNAQLKVAQYSYGKYATDQFEKFEFWAKGGRRSKIQYSYGKDSRKVQLQYLGKSKINGDSCFKVRFSNEYILYIIPTGLLLEVIDSVGKYKKTFSWEYEGPINGIGTHCDVCAEDDNDAMRILRLAYLR